MGYEISNLSHDEVQIACDWAKKEGWGPGVNDGHCFYQADNHGFFKGTLDGEIIAVGSMVRYDANFAFFGLYIVKPEFRRRGFGLKLTMHAHQYAKDCCIGLDGVLGNVHLYERLGYQSFCKNQRFKGNVTKTKVTNKHIKAITHADFNAILTFDRQYFPAPRAAFLKAWLENPSAKALIYQKDQKIEGLGVIRQCDGPAKIGPLFAKNPKIANALLDALLNQTRASTFYLDIPENNENALQIAKERKLESVFSTMRMYKNGKPVIDDSGVFGITSFELG